MDFQVEARSTHELMDVPLRDWNNLIGLAHRYGWQPIAGLDYYLRRPPEVIPESDSRAIAEALERAIPDLPDEEWTGGSIAGTPSMVTHDPVPYGPDPDPQSYFGGERRRIVEEFVALCQRGDLQVHRIA